MTLAERIAQARKQAGLSQEQLGEKLGVSRQAVSKWESAQTNPDVAYLAQMCRVLEVSSDWLLFGEEKGADAPPSRCPSCDSIVSGVDRFCPSCGYSLQGRSPSDLKQGRYTLVLHSTEEYSLTPEEYFLTAERLEQFYRELPLNDEWWIPARLREENEGGTPDKFSIRQFIAKPPVVICGNVDYNTALRAKELLDGYAVLYAYPAECGEEVEQLRHHAPIDALSTPKPGQKDRHMTFGTTVLAVMLGVVAAILLLALL